jgi:hypothetical protein
LEDDESGKLIWIVVDVADGHEYARAKTMNSPQLIEADWLPDGSGWAQLRPGNGNTVCGVFKFSKSGRYNEPVASPMAFHINSFGLIGLVDAGKVLVLGEDKSDGHGNIGKSVTMYALKATSTMVGSAEFSVSDAVIGETALSHDGKRLCWLAFSAKHPFAPGLTATFTVTDVGCRSRRILHSIEFSTLDQMSLLFGDIPKSELPTSIKWTADDKEISYLIGESLWAIAAPQ